MNDDCRGKVFSTVAIGCDHGGFALKTTVMKQLAQAGVHCKDFGTYSTESVDYPDFAVKVADSVSGGETDAGILICGTGLGMAVAANKVPGIRAVTCSEPYSARMARAHNDANVLTVGARVVGPDVAAEIVRVFCATPFDGGRHARRLQKIREMEPRTQCNREDG